MKRDIARELFRTYRNKVQKISNREDSALQDLDRNTNPKQLGEILEDLITERDWRKGISEGSLFSHWRDLVGEEVANHCEPITLLDGRLTIKAKSTAWAVQLKLLAPDLLKAIQTNSSGALVEELHVLGPNTPTWRRGARTIRGAKGPRDTYG